MKLQSVHIPSGKTILNGIQTNGTLIDEEWCRFIAGNGFFSRLKYDGPSDFQIYSGGPGIIRNIRKRLKEGISF